MLLLHAFPSFRFGYWSFEFWRQRQESGERRTAVTTINSYRSFVWIERWNGEEINAIIQGNVRQQKTLQRTLFARGMRYRDGNQDMATTCDFYLNKRKAHKRRMNISMNLSSDRLENCSSIVIDDRVEKSREKHQRKYTLMESSWSCYRIQENRERRTSKETDRRRLRGKSMLLLSMTCNFFLKSLLSGKPLLQQHPPSPSVTDLISRGNEGLPSTAV